MNDPTHSDNEPVDEDDYLTEDEDYLDEDEDSEVSQFQQTVRDELRLKAMLSEQKKAAKATSQRPPQFEVQDIYEGLRTGTGREEVGELVEYWGELVPGYEEQAPAFWDACVQALRSRTPNAQRYIAWLGGSGWVTQRRQMLFVRRGVATGTLYVATQGSDVFVSLRVYIQMTLSWFRLVIVIIAALALPIPLHMQTYGAGAFYYTGGQGTGDHLIQSLLVFVVLAVITVIWGAVRTGDVLAWYRYSMSDLYYDDVASLAKLLHQCVVDAADQVGIESAPLREYTPFFAKRGRRI